MLTKYIYKNYIIVRSLVDKLINNILYESIHESPVRIFNKKQNLLTNISNYYLEPTFIIENLYLGNLANARNYYVLEQLNIKLIVNCAKEIPNYYSDNFEYINFKILDTHSVLIYPYLDKIVDNIHKNIQNNQNVFVHCFMGASRSVSIVIAYLIKYKGYTFDEALKLCNSKRNVVDVNIDFCNQLIEYEKKYKKN